MSGTSANSNWTTGDGSAGRLVSGFISAPLGTGEVVNVYRDGTLLGTATVAAGGTTWAFTDTTSYGGGNNTAATPAAGWTYTAKVADAVGNDGTTVTKHVNLNTSSEPVPVITAVQDVKASNATVANGGSSNNSVFTIQGTGHAAGDEVYVYSNTKTQFLGKATV